MSGIYIKGIEMPTTGLYLVSVDNSCGKDETVMTVKRMLGNRDVCQIIGAYNLVLVPEHGRLIDADALRARMYHEAFETDTPMQKWNSGCWIRYKMFEQMEESAPTIIPASGGKENE